MSAKRFRKLWINEDGDIAITDDGVDLIFTGDAFLIFLNELAEKEATINELKEENKKLIEDWEFSFRTEMAHHRFAEKELQEKIREKQATITEYEDFCYNLCIFIIGKGLADEFREKYGKEYKIITKWKGCV